MILSSKKKVEFANHSTKILYLYQNNAIPSWLMQVEARIFLKNSILEIYYSIRFSQNSLNKFLILG